MKNIDIYVYVNHEGCAVLSTIIGSQYYKQFYFGYSINEAKKRFRQYIKEQTA